VTTGAASFKRLLGCAPMPALGSLLAQRHERRGTASFIEAAAGRPDGMPLGTSSGSTAPARHDARTARDSRLREDLDGQMSVSWWEQFARGVYNNSLVLLSCAA